MLEGLTQHLKLPDLWQHGAVGHLREGSDVIVCAPTGAGKTYVFELFIKQTKIAGQAVYTVPTRALANDKFAEWSEAGWNVGLATGDISENVNAPVLVATLETQIERLMAGDGPALLVMDEFQMIADPSRGAHYEGAIIVAPQDTQLLLLSGSVENPNDVAQWMRRIGRTVEVVATSERPVPLDEMPVEALPQRGKGTEAWWPRMATAVLAADLAPLLIFAPRRKDAESIANKLAANLPLPEPLALTNEQRALAGREIAALLEKRIAYHHSGLAYAVRAGLVEPLAKAGQLRVIVSTMGLAAGINFSVRSVHVSSTSFHDGQVEQTLSPDELLQMFGRAGRRGLDERGYAITSRDSPTLADGRATRLRRSNKLSWPFFLRVMRRAVLDGRSPFAAAREFAGKLFSKTPPELGLENHGGFELGGQAASTLFGLKGTRRELLNSEGAWEEAHAGATEKRPLGEAWIAREDHRGPALGSTKFVQDLLPAAGRVCKVTRADGSHGYGKEIALGKTETGADGSIVVVPTQALRKLLQIPPRVEVLTKEKIETVALPKLAKMFDGAQLLGASDKGGLRWAQFDYASMPVDCVRDSHGRWITAPLIRTIERTTAADIREDDAALAHTARSGTAVHAWRTLGLINADGAPTQRGIVFSFFQHGEGLAIAAALEDESYPLDELVSHLANLRSDCHLELDEPVGSERLGAVCRATFGFVNHHGYIEAGLPLGYGEGTAELLGLSEDPRHGVVTPKVAVSEGDLSRAYIEWLSLLRHIKHAPALDWPRWTALKQAASVMLDTKMQQSRELFQRKLPPLTPKQKHDRPRLWVRGERFCVKGYG